MVDMGNGRRWVEATEIKRGKKELRGDDGEMGREGVVSGR